MSSCRIAGISTLLVFLALQSVSVAADPPAFTPHRNVTVMTYNAYIGADVTPLLLATTPSELANAVAAIFMEVQDSDIPFRASHIANSIATVLPDVVGMQEMAEWSTITPAGETVQFDFLQSVLEDLRADGAHAGRCIRSTSRPRRNAGESRFTRGRSENFQCYGTNIYQPADNSESCVWRFSDTTRMDLGRREGAGQDLSVHYWPS
jgi:hypothetical protein